MPGQPAGEGQTQVFPSRKINPFAIPYHTERSQHPERTAKSTPGHPHAAVEGTGALAGAEQPS